MADQTQGAPPQGAPPTPANLFDPKPLSNYHSTIYAVCISLLGVCWLTTALRLWTRFRITRTPGWDDLFVVLTLVMITTGTVSFCVATRYGLGEHVYLIDLSSLPSFLICHYVIGGSYTSSTALIKISLLFQYLRIFDCGTFAHLFTQVMVVFVALWGLAYSFLSWLCCLPRPSAFWNLTQKGCYAFASPVAAEAVKTIESHAAVNMVLDLVVLTIPFRLLFEKDVPSKTKKGLMVLLFMGVIISGFSVWRLETIVKTQAGFFPVLDPTWNEPGPTLLSFVEVYVAAICASTPVFWPVISQQLTKIFVMYEFKVSSEARHRDDEVELAHTESWPAGTKSTNSSEDFRSPESRSGGNNPSNTSKPSHYTDDYIQHQVNPFAEDFRVETTAQSDATGKKKRSGFV